MEYKGKRILVLGAGRSGIGAAHVLGLLGAKVVLNDYKTVNLTAAEQQLLAEGKVTVITGRQDIDLLTDVDRIVVSPGIALTIPILVEAKQRGLDIVGEVEVAYDISKAPILGVTGTNGKTTTTTLLAEVMAQTGKPIKVGGNIGSSLSEAAYEISRDGYLVAELSSYQLETVKTFQPLGAIVLNITPDHLQRHKTMAAYQAAKENIFAHQQASDRTVLNLDDESVASMKKRVPGKVLCISQDHSVTDGAYFENGQCYAVRGGVAEFVINTAEIHLPGRHNIENILAVIALAYDLGVTAEQIHAVIAQFKGVEHRLEPVAEIAGAMYFNDSKATNTDSAIKAIEAFTAPIILLAGGHDKLTDLTEFMALVKTRVRDLILMGEAAQRFAEAAKAAGVTNIYQVRSMAEAVAKGYELAKAGDVVLLSPACSSFDWYHCFEERGDDFKNEVQALKTLVEGKVEQKGSLS
ncbi:UDP-N-acetylmuramoyl-L-alanine--D-glutamate ligase [Veillonella sp. R32]|uniref:UDP-N-acetylmuramoyl-L-alanine--D-glutamate ligase n=1 Tax=Veillonella sp. R32 TaxID=2021312 RepID=UPI00138A59E0|nr:UDP-N-acetylmuramoyl-L-alanine--D-glutamate ligase [Veillonella sp. R32]KAF1682860.1 UDP-N-acetylmuramoyl-L-alanine--D-glutamate ligase [Veillonella sp. R32]